MKISIQTALQTAIVASLFIVFSNAFAAEGDKPTPKAEGEKIDKAVMSNDGTKELKVPDMKVASDDWCPEHGVPESICSKCSDKAAAQAKKDGDWCKKHKRAESQCFLCHPELKAKWLILKPKDYVEKEEKEPEKK